MKVTLFSSIKNLHPYAHTDLEEVFNVIKTATIDSVLDYRENRLDSDKKKTPVYSVSATFSKRNEKSMITYNGVIVLDIDRKDHDISDQDFEALMDRFKKWKYVWAYHRSISGEGYAVYFKTNNMNPDLHRPYFEALYEVVQKTGIVVDASGKDPSRIRFMSMDSNLTVKDDPEVWTEFKEVTRRQDRTSYIASAKRSEDTEKASRLLSAAVEMEVDLAPTYEDWKKLAFAMANEYGESGRDAFHRICELSEKYDEADTDKVYTAGLVKGDLSTGKTIRSVFEILRKHDII